MGDEDRNLDLDEMLSNRSVEADSYDLADRDARIMWHPYTQMKDFGQHLPVESASKSSIFLSNGTEIIDAISSWWVNPYGHGHPHVREAISSQLSTLDHVLFAGFTHRPAVALGERLLPLLPPNLRRFFFSDNGSTSVEVALKMALQYFYNKGDTKKRVILSFEDAYHGDTFGAMAAGGLGVFNGVFADMLLEVRRIPVPQAGKEKEYQSVIDSIDWSTVCAFIYEPLVQGAAGMRFYSQQGLEAILSKAKENQTVCIADEVMTGFGRLDQYFASNQLSVPPDILCLSKGLTAGVLPMGLTVASEELFEGFWDDKKEKAFMHGHSFTANPVGCAAAHAGLDLLLSDQMEVKRQRLIARQKQEVERFSKHPKARNVRSMGTLFALDVQAEAAYHSKFRDSLYANFISRGVLIRPLGNVLYVLPPFVVEQEELDRVYNAIWDELEKL